MLCWQIHGFVPRKQAEGGLRNQSSGSAPGAASTIGQGYYYYSMHYKSFARMFIFIFLCGKQKCQIN